MRGLGGAALAVALTTGLAGCQKADPAQVEAAVTPCGLGLSRLGALEQMAASGAQGEPYLTQTREVAATCKDARAKLEAIKAPKACIQLTENVEAAAAALGAQLSGRTADTAAALTSSDRTGVACSAEISG